MAEAHISSKSPGFDGAAGAGKHTSRVHRDVDRIIISQQQLTECVPALASEIAADYPDCAEGITLVAVLSGSVIFLADLIRHLPMKMRIDLLTVSSYIGQTTRSTDPKLHTDRQLNVHGRDVLIVDDILDTGKTLRVVQAGIRKAQPKSMRTVVLLRKPDKAPPDVTVDYVGFDIEDLFVVGYGLDYDNWYRNLPYIAVLRPELYGA